MPRKRVSKASIARRVKSLVKSVDLGFTGAEAADACVGEFLRNLDLTNKVFMDTYLLPNSKLFTSILQHRIEITQPKAKDFPQE